MEKTGQAQQALDKLAGEFSSDPGLAGALLSIAEIYRKSKKYEEAKSIYETVVTDYPGTERALKAQKKLAIIYIDVDDDPNAQQAIDKLAQDFSGDPNLADALYEIAKRFEWVRGKYEQAEPIYQQIVQNFPDSAYAKEKLDLSRTNIIYLIESGNYTLAAGALNKLLSEFYEHPDLAWTLDGIAGRYEQAKRYDEARSIYQKIVTDHNETDYALTAQKKLAILEINAGDDAAAQAALDILIADFNDNPALPEAVFAVGEQYYNWAFHCENQSRDAKAKENFQKTIEVWERIITELPPSGTTAEAYYFSAVCYRHLNQHEQAIEHYQKVVGDWPDYERAWNAQFMIARSLDKLARSGAIPIADAAPIIRQACEKVIINYPESKAVKPATNLMKRWELIKSN
jgi:tetratricopeptide (TPR) repeat protein